jgi:RimJ/RimL family protein N-acetyltransferase
MALFESKTIKIKNGEMVTLRPAAVHEAQALLDCFTEFALTSPYILTTAESARLKTLDSQEKWIQASNEDPRNMLIVAEHGDKIVGITNSMAFKDFKRFHRAGLGMTVRQEYRGQGLGEALLALLIELSRQMPGLVTLELNVMAPNVPAHKLYRKFGFKECGRYEKAYRLESGEYVDDIMMHLPL